MSGAAIVFPGAIYDANGRSLNGPRPDLRQDELDAYPHRSLVTDWDRAPVARVWVLADDAAPAAIPPTIMVEAVKLVLGGKGVLILARRREAEVDVRTGLLHEMDLFTAVPEEGGRA